MMKIRSATPIPPPANIGDLQEVFDHAHFTQADSGTRRAVMMASAESKYQGENEYPWDHYFEIPISALLHEKDILDLGCFTGGRTAAWNDRYGFKSVAGVDVLPLYVEAASQFAASRGYEATFRAGFAEAIPFGKQEFDAIVTFDVLEHVRDVGASLDECHRVLRPGGILIAVFPGYFQPKEHHLGLVTKVPGLQLIFSGASLVEAYKSLIDERGADASWYRRPNGQLADWERGHTLNGITFREFRDLVSPRKWESLHTSHKPIGSVGRNVARIRGLGFLASALRPLTFVPGVQELFLHRIAVVLRKVDSPVLE